MILKMHGSILQHTFSKYLSSETALDRTAYNDLKPTIANILDV